VLRSEEAELSLEKSRANYIRRDALPKIAWAALHSLVTLGEWGPAYPERRTTWTRLFPKRTADKYRCIART